MSHAGESQIKRNFIENDHIYKSAKKDNILKYSDKKKNASMTKEIQLHKNYKPVF